MWATSRSTLLVLSTLGLFLFGGRSSQAASPATAADPVLHRIAPEECLFYYASSGTLAADPKSGNQTEQLLAEPEVRQAMAEIFKLIDAAIAKECRKQGSEATEWYEEARQWVLHMYTRPMALYVGKVTGLPDRPDVRAGAVVCPDPNADIEASLHSKLPPELEEEVDIAGGKAWRIRLAPDAPLIEWTARGGKVYVAMGEGELAAMLQRLSARPAKWASDLASQVSVPRPITVCCLNSSPLWDLLSPLATAEARKSLQALGVEKIARLTSVAGLDESGFVSQMRIEAAGPSGGIVGLAPGKPLAPADLAPIPRDATYALAFRTDLDELFEKARGIAADVDPGAPEGIDAGQTMLRGMSGLDLRDDLLKPLGDVWCLYVSPGEGNLLVSGVTLVVSVDDAARLRACLDRVVAILQQWANRTEDPRRMLKIEKRPFGASTISLLVPTERFPVSLSWCVTERRLIVALSPQNVKAVLERPTSAPNLSDAPECARLFTAGGGPVMLIYQDTPEVVRQIYPMLSFAMPWIASGLAREGIELDPVAALPSLPSLLRHIQPGTLSVARTGNGLEIIQRQTLPLGPLGVIPPPGAYAMTPVTLGMLLPAVQSARTTARKASSMNNLKQLLIAAHVYENKHKTFPPAYSVDKEGKPLLSWRVHVLPYLDQEPLYKEFHLDEPWDSPHNKQLIARMPAVFRSPLSAAEAGETNYLGVSGPHGMFPGKDGVKMAGVRDGTSNTIAIVQVDDAHAVPWTQPSDFVPNADRPPQGLGRPELRGFLAAMVDGSVRLIADSIDPHVLKSLFSRNDGQPVALPDD